jgi:hypothetical protein
MRFVLSTTAVAVLMTTTVFLPEAAVAKPCYRAVCIKRAPFVCHGPIGSCGFQQGKCLRYRRETFTVPNNQSCYGGNGPVVR